MKTRFKFLVVFAVFATVAIGMTGYSQAAQKARELRAEQYYRSSGVETVVSQEMFDAISRKSGGKIKIELLGSVIGKYQDALSNGGSGVLDIVHAGGGNTAATNPYFATLGLPGSGNDPWAIAKAAQQMFREARINAELERQNVVSLNLGHSLAATGIVVRKRIKSLADLAGLRVRAPGSYVKIFQELGAIPVSIPGPEVYDALDKGVVDAAFSTTSAILRVKWYEPAKTVILFPAGGAPPTGWYINKKVWDSFTPDIRTIFDDAGDTYTDEKVRRHMEETDKHIKELEDLGVQIYRPTSEEGAVIFAATATANLKWFKEWDAKGLETKRWFSDFQSLVKKYEKEVAEKGYPWKR